MKTENTQRILQELEDLIQEMRENSEVDPRTIIYHIRKYMNDENYCCGDE